MAKENPTRQERKSWRTILRLLGYGGVAAIAVLVVWHFVWKYSGSNQWELLRDEKGIKIYSRKVPGVAQKDFKAISRVDLSLNGVVAAFAATDTPACAEWFRGCVSAQTIQPWNSRDLSYINMWRMPFPAPFSPREVLIKEQVSQDPQSKVVLVMFQALPDAVPRNKCCFRVPYYGNSWRFTPVGNGVLEVEFIMHPDAGIPYPMVNMAMPKSLYRMFIRMPKLLKQDKWQHTRFDRIQEQ